MKDIFQQIDNFKKKKGPNKIGANILKLIFRLEC